MLCNDLVSRNAVGHILARHGITVRTGEPEGAAPVSFVAELIRTSLNDGNVGLVTGQWRETLGKFVVRTRLQNIRKPCLLGDAESDAQENTTF